MEEKNSRVYSYKEIKDLNEVEKNDYINKILREDNQMGAYLEHVKDEIVKEEDAIEDAEVKIDKSKEHWDQEIKLINENIIKKANNSGIYSKEDYYKNYQF